jgi:hypothetical protein
LLNSTFSDICPLKTLSKIATFVHLSQ